jgi:hypothetical protein
MVASLTDGLVNRIVAHMDSHDLQPVVFRKENSLGYTCVGAARTLNEKLGLSEDDDPYKGTGKDYFVTIGVIGLGIVGEYRFDVEDLKRYLREVIAKGMRGYDEDDKVVDFGE